MRTSGQYDVRAGTPIPGRCCESTTAEAVRGAHVKNLGKKVHDLAYAMKRPNGPRQHAGKDEYDTIRVGLRSKHIEQRHTMVAWIRPSLLLAEILQKVNRR